MKKLRLTFFPLAYVLVGLLLTFQAFGQTTVQIDRRITIQPIQVTNAGGSVVANPSRTLFETETDKIWARAGIDVLFLPWVTYAQTPMLNTTSFNIGAYAQSGGQSWSPITSGGTMADTVVRLFFVQTMDSDSGVLGWAQQSTLSTAGGITQYNVMAVADSAFSFNSGNGRRDVIAHELGHLLGLDHTTQGAGGANNLMSSPRNSPSSIADIFPHGGSFDQLTGTIGGTNVGNDNLGGGPLSGGLQIDRARAMQLAVAITPYTYTYSAIPEPATISLIAGSLFVIGAMFVRGRRKLNSR